MDNKMKTLVETTAYIRKNIGSASANKTFVKSLQEKAHNVIDGPKDWKRGFPFSTSIGTILVVVLLAPLAILGSSVWFGFPQFHVHGNWCGPGKGWLKDEVGQLLPIDECTYSRQIDTLYIISLRTEEKLIRLPITVQN